MTNEVERVGSPYGEQQRNAQQGASAVVESQRAVAEVLASMQVARAYPRDPVKAMDQIINDCTMPQLAEDAVYQYARGGSDITGPSIRLAEAIARRWGNIATGVKELGRREGYSEVMAYAIDLETGYRDEKTFQIRHWRDTKSGGYAVKEERDIYELAANAGARRKRACILAVIPQDVVDTAVRQCEITMKAKLEITADFINRLVASFAEVGVTPEMIEKRIQRRIGVDTLTPALALNLRKIRTSIRDGMSVATDWFETGQPAPQGAEATGTAADRLAADLSKKAKPSAEPKAPPQGSGDSQAGSSHVPVPHPAVDAEDETGEITNDSVRKAIAAAKTQDELTMIVTGDMMKLERGAEHTETMRQWNARVMALKPPVTAEDVVSPPRPLAKPHGTAKVKGDIRAKMNKATTKEQLDTAADQMNLYAWDAGDKGELEERFRQCLSDLSL